MAGIAAKPYRVTIHAAGDQQHTYAMGPGDAIGVGTIRIDIAADGSIHASPIMETIVAAVEKDLVRKARRSGQRR